MSEQSHRGGDTAESGDSDPGSVTLVKPSSSQLFARGLTRRCPWCGDRKAYFTSWWGRSDACRQCGRGYRRGDDAFELGAITINIIFTFLSILISLAAVFWLSFGSGLELPLPWVMAAGIGVIVMLPMLFYPLSFTVWQAVDLFMRAPTPEELSGGPDARL